MSVADLIATDRFLFSFLRADKTRLVAYDFNAPSHFFFFFFRYSFRIHSLLDCLTFEMLRVMLMLMLIFMFMSDVPFLQSCRVACWLRLRLHVLCIPISYDPYTRGWWCLCWHTTERLGPLTYFTLELIQIDQCFLSASFGFKSDDRLIDFFAQFFFFFSTEIASVNG